MNPTSDLEPARRSLEIRRLTKRYGDRRALGDVSLSAGPGEFVALLGPSGAGKTTLLRVLAGLERPDAGEVRFGAEDLLAVPPRRRRAGMVFQHYALFRHMTVAQNIGFGLAVRERLSKPTPAAIRRRVGELLALVRLEGLEGRYPAQLSGGQRQRVAFARALAIEPRLLLLDEPFGALDTVVRRELRLWLREAHARTGVTTLFVTHDQDEALELADRIALLRGGEVIQVGAPSALWEAPASAFVYEFLGPWRRLEGSVKAGRLCANGWTTPAPQGAPAGEVDVYFRPDEVELATPGEGGVAAVVRSASARGATLRLECSVEGRRLELVLRLPASPTPPQAGAEIRFRPMRPQLFARGGA